MKIRTSKNKITVQIITQKEISNINDYIKKVILTLKRKHKVDIFGFYKVNVYINNKIGIIIDIIKDHDIDYINDLLDLKIKVYNNSPMFLEFDDYVFKEKKDLIIKNNNYYLEVTKIEKNELLKLIEFCKIIYGEKLNEIE